MKTVADVRSKVEKFRWENKKRSFEGDLQDLKSLYWHIVFHEILGDNKLDLNNGDYLKSMMCKIAGTYRGVFFWYFELKPALKQKFEGLHFSTITEDKELWNSWKEEVDDDFCRTFEEILRTVRFARGNRQFIDEDYKIGHRSFDLEAFSDHHSNKVLCISEFLRNHRLYKIYVTESPSLPIVDFQYSLKKQLIERLHRLGERLIKNGCISEVLYECNEQFEKIEKIKIDLKKNKKKIKGLPNIISAYKKMSLKAAMEDIFKVYPLFKELPLSQVKYHIIERYRDSEGRKFKDNTVDRALRRAGYMN